MEILQTRYCWGIVSSDFERLKLMDGKLDCSTKNFVTSDDGSIQRTESESLYAPQETKMILVFHFYFAVNKKSMRIRIFLFKCPV